MLRVTNVIFADDIRQEVNGKFLLVGVYGGQMVVSQFPFAGNIHPAVTVDAPLNEIKTMSARIGSKGGAVFGAGSLSWNYQDVNALKPPKTSFMPLAPVGISLSAPDTVQLWISINGEPEQLGGELEVVQGIVQQGPAPTS